MFAFYLFAEFLYFTVLGLTATVIQLETARHVTNEVFTTGLLSASLIAWQSRQWLAKPQTIAWVREHFAHILIAECVLGATLAGATLLDWNYRLLWINTVGVLLVSVGSTLWELVKEDKGNGTYLHNRVESAESKGYFIGAALYLILLQLEVHLSVELALFLQTAVIPVAGYALWRFAGDQQPVTA